MIAAFLITMLLTMVFIRIATRGARRDRRQQAAYTSGIQSQHAAFYEEQAAFYEEQAAFYEEQADFYRSSTPRPSPVEPTRWAESWNTDDDWDTTAVSESAYGTADDDYSSTFDEGFLHEAGIDPRSFR